MTGRGVLLLIWIGFVLIADRAEGSPEFMFIDRPLADRLNETRPPAGCWSDKGDRPRTAITSDGARPIPSWDLGPL
jgi:hypothetical protein